MNDIFGNTLGIGGHQQTTVAMWVHLKINFVSVFVQLSIQPHCVRRCVDLVRFSGYQLDIETGDFGEVVEGWCFLTIFLEVLDGSIVVFLEFTCQDHLPDVV